MTDSTPTRSLTFFKLLSFDIYATLIDWKTGIATALNPLKTRLPASSPLKTNRAALLKAFHDIEESLQQQNPTLLYSDVLAQSYTGLAHAQGIQLDDENEAKTFAASIGSWPAFPDTVAAMQTLAKHYKLVPLSNVDRDSFSKTLAGPLKGVQFDAIYTAQDIGSYKPDVRNFEYLLRRAEEDFGVRKEEVLHVAQALRIDIVPCKEIGLASCWISRGEEEPSGELAGRVGYGWMFPDLGTMAEEVEREFEDEGTVGCMRAKKSSQDFEDAQSGGYLNGAKSYQQSKAQFLASSGLGVANSRPLNPSTATSVVPIRYEQLCALAAMAPDLSKALRLIDKAHAQDPRIIESNGAKLPYELHYAKKMSSYLEKRAPFASDNLRLAIRAQHFRRWEVPRDAYPMNKQGYHAWRTFLKKRQAEQAEQICLDCGYSEEDVRSIGAMIRKENLKKDEQTQILEDVACLVFLDDQFEEFEKEHDEDKIVSILRKTWGKMSDKGHELALDISMSDRAKGLVQKALS